MMNLLSGLACSIVSMLFNFTDLLQKRFPYATFVSIRNDPQPSALGEKDVILTPLGHDYYNSSRYSAPE